MRNVREGHRVGGARGQRWRLGLGPWARNLGSGAGPRKGTRSPREGPGSRAGVSVPRSARSAGSERAGREAELAGRVGSRRGTQNPQEERGLLGRDAGSQEGTRRRGGGDAGWPHPGRGRGSASPASDVVVVHVPANVPQDHVEDEQHSQEEQSHEDGLGHRGYHSPRGPAKGAPRGPEERRRPERRGCHLPAWRGARTGRKVLGPAFAAAPAHCRERLGLRACGGDLAETRGLPLPWGCGGEALPLAGRNPRRLGLRETRQALRAPPRPGVDPGGVPWRTPDWGRGRGEGPSSVLPRASLNDDPTRVSSPSGKDIPGRSQASRSPRPPLPVTAR